MAGDRPDLILLDLRLPGMDGLALVRQLKSDPETRGIPIVAMTAFPERFGKTEMLAAGCAAFLAKPLNTRTSIATGEVAAAGTSPTE